MVTTAAGLVVFPVLAGILGAVIAVLRPPPPAVVSGVQHFAAGVVMAAVAGEVLPQLSERGPLWLIVVGFAAGVAVLVGMRHLEGEESSPGAGGLPVVFLIVVGVDLFIDGLLVGTGAAVSAETAKIISTKPAREPVSMMAATSPRSPTMTVRFPTSFLTGLTLSIRRNSPQQNR